MADHLPLSSRPIPRGGFWRPCALSLRARILLLVLCATLAPALVSVYLLAQDRKAAITQAREKLQSASKRIADDLRDTVHSTAQLHYGLSRARDIDTEDRAACSVFLAKVLEEYPQYTGLLTIRPDGRLFCDSLRSGKDLILTDRRYFQQVVGSGGQLALEATFGRITGKAVLQIASGARNANGTLKFILLSSLDLDKYMRGHAQSLPFQTAVLALLDQKGSVLTWHPPGEHKPGASLAGTPIHRFAQGQSSFTHPSEGTGDTLSRVWAVSEPQEFPDVHLSVLIGVSKTELTAAADERLGQTLVIVAIVSLLAFVVGWALAEGGVRRPMQRIMEATVRFRAGDMSARVGEPYARGELGALMHLLDDTAAQLEHLNIDLERRVAERTQQLQVANQDLESFSYSVSHDLRTPLRAIDGFTHLLEREHAQKLNPEGRRLLGVVRDRARKMGELIDELLQFSRLGRNPLELAAIDMEKLVQTALEELGTAGARGQARVDIGPLPEARGDPALIKQVWLNLLSNAIKFSRQRSEPQIQIRASSAPGETVYSVRDNGAGFDMKFYDKLFGVFERLHDTGTYPGTGVGLAIVKRIIERHGGRVWAQGEVDAGASFFFSLPTP